MRLVLAALILVAAPAAAQITIGPIEGGREPSGRSPGTRASPPGTSNARTPGRQTARTAYGYRLAAPDENDDPTDRRVLRRLNTRLNNRLETRIERYRFVDTQSDRAEATTRNPYAPRPATDATRTAPVLRKRPPEDR